MRIVALTIIVAIVYLAYGWIGAKHSPQARVAEAQAEAAQVLPVPASAAPSATSGSLRAPTDRTRQVLESVKQRNVE